MICATWSFEPHSFVLGFALAGFIAWIVGLLLSREMRK